MTIESWPRPQYESGGGDAQVLYAVFGAFEDLEPLSSSRYRSAGPPPGVEMMSYGKGEHPLVFDDFLSGWAWEQFASSARELSSAVADATQCLVLRGVVSDPETLDYFRDVIGLVTYLVDGGGIAVYDAQILKWWSADEWREEIFAPARPHPHQHVAILVTDDEPGRGRWFHTRGMRKFGRPDLSVTNVPEGMDETVVDLIGRFIELQALGGRVSEGQAIRVAGLPVGLECRHGGDAEHVEFNNSHIEIAWPESDP